MIPLETQYLDFFEVDAQVIQDGFHFVLKLADAMGFHLSVVLLQITS